MNTIRTFLALLTFIALFVGCKKEEAQPQIQLVQNGNVEQKFQNWFFNYDAANSKNPNGYDFGFTAEAASSPQYSLKINCNTVKSDSAFCFYGQSFATPTIIATGAKVTLSTAVKTVNLKGKGVSIALRGDKMVNGRNTQVFFTTTQGKMSITGTNEFKTYSVTLDSYPGNIDNLIIFLVYLPETTGAVYFDDVSLAVN